MQKIEEHWNVNYNVNVSEGYQLIALIEELSAF